jgi:hypothetical protein
VNRFDLGQRTKRKWREPQVRVPAVRWTNLPIWLAKTAVVDIRDYDRRGRPLTLERLRASLPPRVVEPVVVVGAPRSGTSFLGGCIGALDSVSYHREPVAMKAVARHVYVRGWSPERADRTYRTIYAMLLGLHLAGDRRLVDKTPQNAFVVPSLAQVFPDARFIHIIRDGRDAATSYLEKPWARQVFAWTRRRDPAGEPYGPFAPWWVEPDRRAEFESTSDVHRAIWVWRRYLEAAREGTRSIDPARWIEVRYEALMTDPKLEADRILDFLGVEDDAERERLQVALSRADPASLGRWRERFDDLELEVIEREAGKLLMALGYA